MATKRPSKESDLRCVYSSTRTYKVVHTQRAWIKLRTHASAKKDQSMAESLKPP